MSKDNLGANSGDNARSRARSRLADRAVDLQSMPWGDIQELVHELQAHQIELEMHNKELRRAQEEIQEARAKYADLYEFAPVGYFTLDRRGLILEANLTGARRLGTERSEITGVPFFLKVAPEDRELFYAHLRKVFASRASQSCELKLSPREGVFNHFVLESIALHDYGKNNPQCRIAVTDITEINQAKEEITRLATFPQLNPNPILEIDPTGAITYNNKAAVEKIRKLGLEDLRSLLPGDLDEKLAAITQQGEKSFYLEINQADAVFFVYAHYTPQWQAVRLYYTDVTERRQAEEALRKSEDTLKGIFKATPIGIGLVKNRRFDWTNEQVSDITGYSADELQGQSARLLYEDDEEFARVGRVKYDEIRESGTGTIETRFKCKDGSVKDILLCSAPLTPVHPTEAVIFTALDITERRRSREELLREKEKYRVLTEESPLGVAMYNSNGRFQYLNPKFVEIFGYTLADIPTGNDWFAKAFPDALYRRQVMSDRVDDLKLASVGESRPRIYSVICKDGQERIIHFRPVTLETQNQLIICEDISERTRAEAAFQLLVDGAPIGIYIVQGGKFVLVNPGFEAITGYHAQELLGKDSLSIVIPKHQAFVRKQAIQMLKKQDSSPYEYQFTSKGGDPGWVLETVITTQYGGKRAVLGYFMDITAQKKLEDQFLQAQKMEAVGRLAGGLAHDFSNILAIIIIYVEIILKDIRKGDPLGLHVKGIKKAALKAISLTRQLLAFGRRQIMQPRAINLNALVSDLEEMMRRLLGEDIELVLSLDPVAPVAQVDPSQVEQVLLNLAVNAREAMPQGGKLTIAITKTLVDNSTLSQHVEVTPGSFVMLAVSDTGIGMDQETQSHILEPFYTTKLSEGSGLGLSTVYGIVKQSGGFIEFLSEPGKGSTFKIFLPSATATLEPPAQITESPLLRGSETILLVEDVDELRQLVDNVLKDYGYTVLAARHGREALRIGERHQGPIHLLLLDVVLPKMSGGELAERLKLLFPEAKVLYMSGYPEDAIIHQKVAEGAGGYIQKPFSPMTLASKVREVLGSLSQNKTPSHTEI